MKAAGSIRGTSSRHPTSFIAYNKAERVSDARVQGVSTPTHVPARARATSYTIAGEAPFKRSLGRGAYTLKDDQGQSGEPQTAIDSQTRER